MTNLNRRTTSNAGEQAIRIEDYHPTNETLEHKEKIVKKTDTGTIIGNRPLAPLVAGVSGVRKEIAKEYDTTKESYIGIDGLREDDHSITWMCYIVGDSAGPLKTIMVSTGITIPKDNDISQLTASFEARLKCFERNILGNIRRFFKGGTAKLLIGNFTVHLKD
jgi:hypothetical protein